MGRFLTGTNAAILLAIVYGAFAFSGDPVIAVDTPFYLRIADGLLEDPATVLLAKDRVRVTVLALPILLVGARELAPEHWPYLIVLANVLCLAAAGGLLVALVRIITQSALAALAALLLYMSAFDLVAWIRHVLTDNLFVLAAMSVFYLLIAGIVREDPSAGRRVRLGLALLVSVVTRAEGAILVPVAIFAEWWSHRPLARTRFARTWPWILLLVLAAAGMFVRAYFFADIRRWPSELLRPMLEDYAAREKTGDVVYDRVEARTMPPQSVLDHVVVQANRFVRFFQFRTRGFSRMHNLVNTGYFIPLYLLALLGLAEGLLGNDRIRKRIAAVTLLWILSVAFLHAVTILDYDWRHRLPVMPMLILLAACGVDAALRRYRLRVRSTTYNGRART